MPKWLTKVKNYLHNDAVAIDQTANVFRGGLPDETISSASQRAADRGNPIGKAMTAFLHLFQKNHGKRAEQGDIRRAQAVEKADEQDLNGTTPPRNNQ